METDDDAVMAQAWREHGNAPAAPATAPSQASAAATTQPTDYADAWNRHDTYLDDASRKWNQAKVEHPNLALLGSLAPVTGEISSVLELNDAHNRGDKTGMATAATGLIPGTKLVHAGVKAIRRGEAIQHAARNTLSGADAYSAAKKAGQALKNGGAAKVAAGGGAETASTASNLADYAHAWRHDAQ
jgi:hypothetical protein